MQAGHVRSSHTTRHVDMVLRSVVRSASDDYIERSWRRCVTDHKLDPSRPSPSEILSQFELRMARSEAGRLLWAADDEIDRLHAMISALDYSVLLADTSGVIVAQRTGAGISRGARHWHLCTGAVWHEMREGTNGVGTCLAEQRAVAVHRDAHFRACYGTLSCSVAPVFGPGGDLVAALDVSSFRADISGAALPLVMGAVVDAAQRIERRLFASCYPNALVVDMTDAQEARRGESVALLALDPDRRILGATRGARKLLRLDDRTLAEGCGLGGALFDRAELSADFTRAEQSVIEATLARAQGNVSEAARLLGVSRSTLHRKLHRLRQRSPEQQV